MSEVLHQCDENLVSQQQEDGEYEDHHTSDGRTIVTTKDTAMRTALFQL